jgi:hypothetical protein
MPTLRVRPARPASRTPAPARIFCTSGVGSTGIVPRFSSSSSL